MPRTGLVRWPGEFPSYGDGSPRSCVGNHSLGVPEASHPQPPYETLPGSGGLLLGTGPVRHLVATERIYYNPFQQYPPALLSNPDPNRVQHQRRVATDVKKTVGGG